MIAIFSDQRGHLIRQLYYIKFPINYLSIKIGKKSPLSLVLIFWHGALSSVGVVTNSTFAPLCNKKRNFVVVKLRQWSGKGQARKGKG